MLKVEIVKVDLSGLEHLAKNMPEMIEWALNAISEEIVTDIKLSMTDSPADGHTYTRGSVTHTASSPGNPPRPDLAALLNSIHWQNTGHLHRTISDQVEYGIYLEHGTEHIEARPFMTPVFVEWGTKLGPYIKGFLKV